MAALGNLSLQLAVDIRQLIAGEKLTEEALLRISTYADKSFGKLQSSADSAASSLDKKLNRSLFDAELALKGVSAKSAEGIAALAKYNNIDVSGATAKLNQLALMQDLIASKASQAASQGGGYDSLTKGLTSVDTAAQKAAFALANGGQSAKQLGFALRNVPAQFSDIVVSLQGGQKPLTIFLQQGTQLKDLFGGAGNAAKALGGYVLGLINPFSLAAVAVGGLAYAYYQGSEQINAYNKAIINSGNFAGQSIGQLQGLAQSVGAVKGHYSDAREAVVQLAASGVIGSKQLEIATKGVVDGVTLTGGKVQGLVKDFALLAKDPVKGLLQLNEGTNFLTASTYQQVAALEKQGKHQEAVTLAFSAYQSAISGRSSEIVERLDTIERAWRGIKEQASKALEGLASIRRPKTGYEQAGSVKKQIESLTFARNIPGNNKSYYDQLILEKKRELAGIENTLLVDAAKASARGIKTQNEQKLLAAQLFTNTESKNAANLNKKDALAAAIEAQRQKFAPSIAAYKDDVVKLNAVTKLRDQAIANLQASAAAPGGRKAGGARGESELDRIAEKLKALGMENALLAQGVPLEDARTIAKLKGAGATDVQIVAMLNATAVQTQFEVAEKASAKTKEELTKAQQQYTDSLAKTLETSYAAAQSEQDRVDALQRQIDVFGLSEQAVSALEAAKLLDAAATYEQSIALMQQAGASKETVDWTYAQIDAIKDRAKAIEQFGVKNTELDGLKEAKKAREEAKKEQEKYWSDVENYAKKTWDSITSGGKLSFKSLKDTAKTVFFDWLYGLTLKKWIINVGASASGVGASGLAQAAGNLLGNPTGAATGGFGIGGISSLLKTGYDFFTSGLGQIASIDSSIQSLSGVISNAGFAKLGGGLFHASGTIASIAPYAGALISLAKGDIKGAAIQGAATLIGSSTFLGPVGGAIIGALVNGIIGGGKKSYPNINVTGSTYANGIYTQGGLSNNSRGNIATDAIPGLNDVGKAFAERTSALLKNFGLDDSQKQGFQVKFGKQLEALFTFTIANGATQTIGKWGNNYGDTSEAATKAFIEDILSKGIVAAVKSSNISADIKKLFDGSPDSATTTKLINSVGALGAAQTRLIASFGLTANTAAKVASATGLAGDAIATFIDGMVQAAGGATQAQVLLAARANLATLLGGAIPTDLAGYDALIKGTDKTSKAGIDRTAQLFGARAGFEQYAGILGGLKGGLDSSTFGLRSQAEQAKLLNDEMTSMFAKLGVAVPKTTADLLNLADTTKNQLLTSPTEAVINLAAAFPNLIDLFKKTKEGVDNLSGSLNDSYGFASRADELRFEGVANNYGTNFAADYTANVGARQIVNGVNAADGSTGAALVEQVKLLRDMNASLLQLLKANLILAENSTETIAKTRAPLPATA